MLSRTTPPAVLTSVTSVRAILLLLVVWTSSAFADVAVISNRLEKGIAFTVAQKGKPQQTVKLASGDVYSFFFDGQSAIAFNDGEQNRQVELLPQQIYFFGATPDGTTFFQQLPITGNPVGAFRMETDKLKLNSDSKIEYSQLGMKIIEVPIKIYVDDNEKSKRAVWEPRLRKRIDKVNEIFEQTCHVRFKIVDVGQWKSDDNIMDFYTSMKEFEVMAPAHPAVLAIGFTSQYGVDPNIGAHIGLTRQPFHTHILIREFAPQFSENERVEALIHELGHWLGAVHTPDSHCYMNPYLADRQSRRTNYVKAFNPLNTLLLNLWADVWANRKNGLISLADQRIEDLIDVYAFMSKIPHTDDNAASIEKLLTIVAQQEQQRREQIRRAKEAVKPVLTMPDDLDTYASTIPQMKEEEEGTGDSGLGTGERSEKREARSETKQSEEETGEPGDANPQKDNAEPSDANPQKNNGEPGNANPKNDNAEPGDANPQKNNGEPGNVSPRNDNAEPSDASSQKEIANNENSPEANSSGSPSKELSVNKAVQFVSEGIIAGMKGQHGNPRDNSYVNQIITLAAKSAKELPEKHRVRAFLVAIGLAMDASNSMKSVPVVGERVKKMDPYDLQLKREAIITQPSINDRQDWSQHFGVSAALSAIMSPDAARQAGLIKELNDDQMPGNAFDVGDFAADLAGCTFAQQLLDGKITLESVAENFDVARWIPDVKGYKLNVKKPDKIMKDIQKKVDECQK